MDAGDVIAGRYRLEKLLGRGGMGAVYLATDARLDRHVAVKLMLPSLLPSEIVGRFQREAVAAARLRSPHIVTVHDYGIDQDHPFIVFEYIPGRTVDAMLRQASLGPARAVAIAAQACRALEAAHEAAIVHRDMKPSNLMVTEDGGRDHVVVLDFGVAKVRDALSVESTGPGIKLGTPSYMSPEQCRGLATIDHRADLYTLGCTLFHMVTGRPPFEGPLEAVFNGHL